jgi:hypothetical protein
MSAVTPSDLAPANTLDGTEIIPLDQRNGASVSTRGASVSQVTTASSSLMLGEYATAGDFLVGPGPPFLSLSQAVAQMGTAPGVIRLMPGIYQTDNTIVLGQGQSIVGQVPFVAFQAGGSAYKAAIIQASPIFPQTGVPVIEVVNASGVLLENFTIDCNFIPNAVGWQYHSTNAPQSCSCRFQDMSVANFHIGFVSGINSLTPDTNNYQADTFVLDGFVFRGNLGDATCIGILINSGNTANASRITRGCINGANIGVAGIKTNGIVLFEHFNVGSAVGAGNPGIGAGLGVPALSTTGPTCYYFGPYMGPYMMLGMETEGNWPFVVVDQSGQAPSPGNTNYTVWQACGFFSSYSGGGVIQVTGTTVLTSIANTHVGTAPTELLGEGQDDPGSPPDIPVQLTLSGTASVTSIGETLWGATVGAKVAVFNQFLTVPGALKGLNYVAATAANVVGTNVQAGDLVASRTATTGQLWLGTDNLGSLNRDATGLLVSLNGWGAGQRAAVAPVAGRSIMALTNSAPFRMALSNDVAPASPIAQTIGTTVAGLATAFPAGALGPIAGDRAVVTDATSTVFLAAAVGGGTNRVPVFYDGTGWKIG